jgi:CubicO group peptidase (beta-lactamase class C family)
MMLFLHRAAEPAASDYYGWSFWILHDHEEKIYYLRGHLGQYVAIVPARELVIVRLGEESLPQEEHHHREFRVITEEVLKAF